MTQKEFLSYFPDYCIQVFDDVETRKDGFARVGKPSKFTGEQLEKWNKEGRGIFFSVNRFPNGERKQIFCQGVNAWFAECDSLSIEEQWKNIIGSPLAPSFVVRSKKSYHIYWLAKDGTKENFIRIQQGLCRYFSGDTNMTDIARVLRVPGYYHVKNQSDPFLVEITEANPELVYTEEDMLAAFPYTEPKEDGNIDVKKEEKQKQSASDWFWDALGELKNKDVLEKLSGTDIVNGEVFSFRKRNPDGRYIDVNGKPSGAWLDKQGMIGSKRGDGRSAGGPTWIQWLGYYGKSKAEIAEWAKKNFKEYLEERESAAYESEFTKRDETALIKNSNGPIVNMENVVRILRNDPAYNTHFRFNTFVWEPETDILTGEWTPITNAEIYHVMRLISRTIKKFEKVGSVMVKEALVSFSREKEVNPPADYFKRCAWDGTPRVNSWLASVFGVENSQLNQAIGSNWLKAMVKRAVEPGCKFDEVLVLESPQGWKKTTALYVLCSPWFVETAASAHEKDFFMLLTSNLVVEFSEGSTLSRSDLLGLKSVITRQEDKYRPPYEPSIMRFKRRCVFAMTLNEGQYLKDTTGNRRWLPVKLEREGDIEWLRANRDQLFAEAYHRVVNLKETTWEYPKEELRALQASREVEQPYMDQLEEWYMGLSYEKRFVQGITVEEAFMEVWKQGVSGQPIKQFEQQIIAKHLRDALFLTRERKMVDGEQKWRWWPTEKTQKILDDSVSQRKNDDVSQEIDPNELDFG